MNDFRFELLGKITNKIKNKGLTPDQVKVQLKQLFKIDKIGLLSNKQLEMFLNYLN